MDKQRKFNLLVLILSWACSATAAATAIISVFTIRYYGIVSLMIFSGITLYTIFNSIWFTVRHNKYKYGVVSLILSIFEIILAATLVTNYISYINNPNLAIAMKILPVIAGSLSFLSAVSKLVFEIFLFRGYRSGTFVVAEPKHKPSSSEKPVKEKKEIKVKPFKEWFYVTHPKTLFFAIGGFISTMSIFGMFGAAIKVGAGSLSGNLPYNMFEAAFGTGKSELGSKLYASVGLIFLLAMLVTLIVLSIIDFLRPKKIGEGFFAYNGVRSVLTLVVIIMSFCTVVLVNDTYMSQEQFIKLPFALGPGPVAVAVLNIIALVTYIAGFIVQLVGVAKGDKVATATKNAPTKKISLPKIKIVKKEEAKPEPVNNEKTNIELLREYKKLLDDGVITKKEFDEKKKKLL